MLTKKQVEEIREHLDKAQNPLFFFDNDPDGLCSFLLLQKYKQRGKGVPIRSFPGLNELYFRKISELAPDYVFILDKPNVSKEFFERAREINIPIVWIDHHKINREEIPDFVYYYNPIFNKKSTSEPVTRLCYQINPDEKLDWITVAGCVSDKFFPKAYLKFKKKYPELSINSEDAFDIFYNSQIGKISRIFSFGLKDSITNVVIMLKFLVKAEGPYDVLEENSHNHLMHKRFNEIDSKYKKLLNKAIELVEKDEKLIFFQYGGDLSISSDISNELSFMYPKKFIIVAYIIGAHANISGRGKNIREKVLEAIKDFQDATGGGHEDAIGARVRVEDLELFRKRIQDLIEGNKK